MGIFAELADNGLYGCMLVVGADRRKESHFGALVARGGNERLGGPMQKILTTVYPGLHADKANSSLRSCD